MQKGTPGMGFKDHKRLCTGLFRQQKVELTKTAIERQSTRGKNGVQKLVHHFHCRVTSEVLLVSLVSLTSVSISELDCLYLCYSLVS
jgi:hypothetical protein